MTGSDTGSMIYLAILGGMLVVWYITSHRASLGKTLQQAVLWGLIFLGTIAAIGLWDDIRSTVRPSQAMFDDGKRIELPRAPDGHYYLTLDLNGTPVRFMIDTGASGIVLTREDADRIGLSPTEMRFTSQAMTANGIVRTAIVTLDEVSAGPITDRAVRAYVNSGDLGKSLLGMSYLQRFDRVEIAQGRMLLERR